MIQRFIALAGLVALVSACSSNPPVIDYDKSIDFSGYGSYAFISDHPLMRAPESPPGSPLLEGKLINATDEFLQARGFTKADNAEEADFAIGFTVGARDKIRVNSYPQPYHPYYGGWGWGGPYYAGSSNVDVQQYTEGTLAIDIYDVKDHKPAWHGVATKRITDSMRRNPDESIHELIVALLSGFPPGMPVAAE